MGWRVTYRSARRALAALALEAELADIDPAMLRACQADLDAGREVDGRYSEPCVAMARRLAAAICEIDLLDNA